MSEIAEVVPYISERIKAGLKKYMPEEAVAQHIDLAFMTFIEMIEKARTSAFTKGLVSPVPLEVDIEQVELALKEGLKNPKWGACYMMMSSAIEEYAERQGFIAHPHS